MSNVVDFPTQESSDDDVSLVDPGNLPDADLDQMIADAADLEPEPED